ncbi:hypothetical protein L218DRAFT_1003028 [Marasmius fiardii PR-910]|nr:hypothetical protein L218DRAFT_1003028 [Marasmius fiardii PR-910]
MAAAVASEDLVNALNRLQIVTMVHPIQNLIVRLSSEPSIFTAVSAALFVYEIIITLPIEIENIWMRRWSFFTVLYLLQRYLPLFDTVVMRLYIDHTPNLDNCALYYKITGWSYTIGSWLSETLLTLRVWAIWERSTSVGRGLLVFLLALLVAGCVCFSKFMSVVEYVVIPLTTHICFITSDGRNAGYIFLEVDAPLVVAFAMMLIPGVQVYRRGGRTQLIDIIYRDGILHYVLLFPFFLMNMIIIRFLPSYTLLFITFTRVMLSILISRALLHIRQVAWQRSSCPTLSQIQFSGSENENLSSRVGTGQRSIHAQFVEVINSVTTELE